MALTYSAITLFSGTPVCPTGGIRRPHSAIKQANLNAGPQLCWRPRKAAAASTIDPCRGAVGDKELRLSELSLSPLDFIYAAQGSRDAQPSEIEWRVLYTLRRNQDGFAPDAVLRIDPGRGDDWTATDLSYGEFAELLQAARKLITGVRGIDGSELNVPERNQAAGVDLQELSARADACAASLRATLGELQLLDNTTDSESLRGAILKAAQFGIAAPVPLSPKGDTAADRDLLSRQVASIATELAERVAQLENSASGAASSDPNQLQLSRLRTIFGKPFVILPQFSAANATELKQALTESETIQHGDPCRQLTRFQRCSVREAIARLNASLAYAEALETGAQLNLRVVQLPFAENDRWVALPLQPDRPLSASRFSLVVQAANSLDVTQPLAGALIDEWVELVPNSSETTGVVFQYDQPGTSPPQCILLAVPPDLDQPWNLWSLQQVLLETPGPER